MDSIEKTRRAFEKSFAEKNFYDRQTRDDTQLEAILNLLEIKDGDRILDFGTGSGYLAFAVGEKFPQCAVVGLDIVSDTLARNRDCAAERGLRNLEFMDFDGLDLPFGDGAFDWVITRFVLHHVPDIRHIFGEVFRVLKPGGHFFLADPTPNDADAGRFVDDFMSLKDDGHNRLYTLTEFTEFAAPMTREKFFSTTIRFPRKSDKSYADLLDKTDAAVKRVYEIELVGDDECFIALDILNILFRKNHVK